MKRSSMLVFLIICADITLVQSAEDPNDSFQTSLTNFLSSLFGHNNNNDNNNSTTSTSSTTDTGASNAVSPVVQQTSNITNGTAQNNSTVSNSTTNVDLSNATLDQNSSESAAILNSVGNQTVNVNASGTNQTVNNTGTDLSAVEPGTNVTNDNSSVSTASPQDSSTVLPSTSSYTTSFRTTSMDYSDYSSYDSSSYDSSEESAKDKLCYKPTVVSNFCPAPTDMTDVSFWDLYSAVFSDAVIDGLLMGCQRGTWCLKDKYDYWDALIAERVDIVMNSQIITSVCEPGVISCVDRMAEFFNNCSFYYQMTYTSNVLDLVCDLRRNSMLTEACYKHVIEALHVTLADLVREESQPEDYAYTSPDDTCKTPEAYMTQGLICVVNSCPGEENTFKNFKSWLWFTQIVDRLIEKCDYNITECTALLQIILRGEWMYLNSKNDTSLEIVPQGNKLRPLNYVGEEDLQMMIIVSTTTMVTAVFLSLSVCLCYRRYRRNAVIKDGYQQLLNDGEES